MSSHDTRYLWWFVLWFAYEGYRRLVISNDDPDPSGAS